MPRCTKPRSSAPVTRSSSSVNPDDPRPVLSAGRSKRRRLASPATGLGSASRERPGDSAVYDSSSDDEECQPGCPDSGSDTDYDDYDSGDPQVDFVLPTPAGFKWQKRENVPKRFRFTGRPGVNVPDLNGESEPSVFFSQFFTDELLEILVQQTNRHLRERPLSTEEWEDLSVSELRAYLGVRLVMGLNPKPSLSRYWSTDPLYVLPIIPQTMTRDRFEAITRHLRAVEEYSAPAADDRLWKLRPVIDLLSRRFVDVYTPPMKITINESRQFSHFRVKVHKLAVSVGPTQGYVCNFRIYAGGDRGDLPASTKAVIDLMGSADLFGKGYELHTDNCYSSPTLFHYLQDRRTNAVGAVTAKFMPTDLQVKARGDVDYRSTATGMLALRWVNKRPVNMLSTIHGSEMVVATSRSGQQITMPRVVADHNSSMMRVDLGDQLAQSCPFSREPMKWYKRVLFYLFDMAVVNAFLVHKALGGRMTQLDFRGQLARELRNEHCRKSGAIRVRANSSGDATLQGDAGHFQVPVPDNRYRRCRVCYSDVDAFAITLKLATVLFKNGH
ncbi:piggyBac transposable element-derived protein 4-like [Penaeus japonicus]|uniref:piggyBac transposable element-derived protein 4-like n=1 Tax=Penaeus japonicus TaxID=27405 RepID=UPI001C71606C|nr:piggyBac transposable element-derived protein 4-like [Penaeus japonicus]